MAWGFFVNGVLREKFQFYLIVKEEYGLRFFCEWGAEGEISIYETRSNGKLENAV